MKTFFYILLNVIIISVCNGQNQKPTYNYSITVQSIEKKDTMPVRVILGKNDTSTYTFTIQFKNDADFKTYQKCSLTVDKDISFGEPNSIKDKSLIYKKVYKDLEQYINPANRRNVYFNCNGKNGKAFALMIITMGDTSSIATDNKAASEAKERMNKELSRIDDIIDSKISIARSKECIPPINKQISNSLYLEYDPCCNCLIERVPILARYKWYETIRYLRAIREDSIVIIRRDTMQSPTEEIFRLDYNVLTDTISFYSRIKKHKIKTKVYNEIENPRKFYAKCGYPFTFRVLNINPYKYDVSISETQRDIIDSSISYSMFNELSTFVSKVATSTSAEKNTKGKTGSSQDQVIYQALLKIAQKINTFKEVKINSGDCVNMSNIIRSHKEFIINLDETFTALKLCSCYTYTDYFDNLTADFRNDSSNHISKLFKLYDEFYNMNFSFSYAVPQVKNNDEIYFTLAIKPKNGVTQGLFMQNEEIHVPIRGGFKIDGSIGLFWDNFRNANYSYKPETQIIAPNDTVHGYRVIGQNNKVGGEFGALALSHFYIRRGTGFNQAFSAGAGLTFTPVVRPRYFAGLTLLFGKSSRAAFTGGLVFGETTQFKPYVNYNSFVPTNSDADNTYKQLNCGLFFSFTYNLPFLKSKQSTGNIGDNNSSTGASPQAAGSPTKGGSK